jgi:cytochrome c
MMRRFYDFALYAIDLLVSRFYSVLALSAVALLLSPPPLARSEQVLSPAAQRGFIFVRVHCSHCHAIDKVSESPLTIAPPFRRLHERYPVESLQESLAEGIITGHPSMPEFKLDPGQVNDVITYLKSLER